MGVRAEPTKAIFCVCDRGGESDCGHRWTMKILPYILHNCRSRGSYNCTNSYHGTDTGNCTCIRMKDMSSTSTPLSNQVAYTQHLTDSIPLCFESSADPAPEERTTSPLGDRGLPTQLVLSVRFG